jgi:sugar phosphate isomerase/epimerase
MFELCAISDSVSDDLSQAASVIAAAGLPCIELQSVWKKPVGDLSAEELETAKGIVDGAGLRVACLSHKNLFGAMPVLSTTVDDEAYQRHMDALHRVIAAARLFGTNLVRIMCFRKESVLFGAHGAERAVVTAGAWDRFVELMKPPVRVAQEEGIQLVVENSTKGMVTSAWLARRLVDEVDSSALKVLWDPSNALYFDEPAFPDGYDELRGGYLGHLHVKDSIPDIRRARIDFAPLGEGRMAPHLPKMAQALEEDGYRGVVSLESLYRPPSGDAVAGFHASLPALKALFA